jgi:Zn-dependent M16 (insulinase) family peptidase
VSHFSDFAISSIILAFDDLFAATEADTDDGIPHTLEHLIFLGSEDYPFKGVLDLLANRCLANGTSK